VIAVNHLFKFKTT